jgi:hypothetical protein
MEILLRNLTTNFQRDGSKCDEIGGNLGNSKGRAVA